MSRSDVDGNGVACWDGESEKSLTDALQPPTETCVEAPLIASDCGLETEEEGDGDRLSLVLTTRAAYRVPVVKVLVNAMADRTKLTEELRERIYSAAQEAVMNAVMHGNLRIDASLRDSLQNLMIVHERIEKMLEQQNFAECSIRLQANWSATSLNITVTDSGEGFVPEAPSLDVASEEASGRGLSILGAMCDEFALDDGGRTARMRFVR